MVSADNNQIRGRFVSNMSAATPTNKYDFGIVRTNNTFVCFDRVPNRDFGFTAWWPIGEVESTEDCDKQNSTSQREWMGESSAF